MAKIILTGIVLIILLTLLTPLCVFTGWITGLIIEFLCGGFVSDGLNLFFDTNRFTPDSLPIIGGVLGFIGAFFKSINVTKSKG